MPIQIKEDRLKTKNRLNATIFNVSHIAGEAQHDFSLVVAGEPGQPNFEVAFTGRGKIGHGMDLLLQDVGLWISRALQGRDPMTGKELG